MGWLPCIVRVGGLTASAIEPFHSQLVEQVLDLESHEAELGRARAHSVDVLHEAVPAAAPDVRRLLLRWRRACFNGREIGSSWTPPQEAELPSEVREAMERVVLLEIAAKEKTRDFSRAFDEQRQDERAELAQRAVDPSMARGIGLASPSTAANIDRLRVCPPNQFGRKELKLEQSLLRFISRAALKLSPFSTLTPVGLGVLEERAPSDLNLPIWFPGPFQQHSLLRLKRYLFHQMIEVLFTAPGLQQRLILVLNNSIEEISPGRFRFFRRGYRGPDPETRGTRLNQPAILRMDLNSATVEHMRSRFGDKRFCYAEALATLGSFFDSPERATSMLSSLLSVGFLEPVVPWCNTDVRAETQFLHFLRSSACSDEFAKLIQQLARIIDLEDEFAEAVAPERIGGEISRLLSESWKQVISYAGLASDAKLVQAPKGDLYEDVFIQSVASPNGEIVTLPRTVLEKALEDVEPLLALGNFYDRKVDFLMTCSAFIKKNWPGRRRVGLMDAFAEAQALYREYLKSEADIRQTGNWTATFDPWELESLKDVKRLRSSLAERLERTLAPAKDGLRILPEAIDQLVSEIPPSYALLVGGCLFLQPALANGDLWVLNRLHEGTGRYSSRYTAVMGETLRQRLAFHFEKSSRLQIAGQRAELIDLLCAQGDTLNVHALQTPRVLEFPGENSGAPPERRLTLRDLSIELSEDHSLRLVDSAGNWLLPVHLGGTRLHAMPILVKFLSLFGPGELRPVIPMPQFVATDGALVRDRVSIGRVVVLRRRWKLSMGELVRKQESASDDQFFRALNRWRINCGLPERLFILEKRPTLGDDTYKPQYIDFTSPSFAAVFRTLLKITPEPIIAEEMLPEPGDFPKDAFGQPRALELQLEAVTFGQRESRMAKGYELSAFTNVV